MHRSIALFCCSLVIVPSVLAQRKAFTIDTHPSGADVLLNGASVGTTPYTYRFDKAPGSSFNVELHLEGHTARTVDIGPMLRDRYALAHTLLLELYREHSDELDNVELPFVTVVNDTKPADGRYGVNNGRRLTSTAPELRDLGYPEQLTGAILGALRNTFATAVSVRRGNPRGEEAIRRAKLFVQPRLKQLDMALEEHDDRCYGTVRMNVEWCFMSALDTDSVLFTLERSSVYSAFGEYRSQLLTSAMRDAAHRMIDEEGLRERLLAIHTAGLARSKGERLDVQRPVPITFNGRKEMLAALIKGVVTIKLEDGFGSGFLISNDGYIITNAHVVDDKTTVSVKFNQGFSLDGKVVKLNKDFDLALIKVAGTDLPALTLGDDQQLLVGEELFAIGTPVDEKLGQSVTRGIMSGRRELDGRTFIQTDVSINPGNSGGPVIDE
ncbi:MAG TPA: trypsin-like peptidase domain-containing protein, partial [Flavobacteriales bacterium]|nr:trypsin-like peptidase domain-containing protein [Flavobacteriales bacterium]